MRAWVGRWRRRGRPQCRYPICWLPRASFIPAAAKRRWTGCPMSASSPRSRRAQSRPSRSSRGVYLRTADLFRGADFFRGTPFRVGGLRASLTALPAWNRTALLAAISMVSPVRGFRPSRAGRAAKGSCWQSGGQPGVEQRPALWVLGQEDRDRHGDVVALAALPAGASG
jgi:hypothetical protein